MKTIEISELEKINDFIEDGDRFIFLSDVLGAIGEVSYSNQRDATADEVIEFLSKG